MRVFTPSKVKNERKQIKIEEENLDRELAKVRFFSGSLLEYESFVGYKVKIIDTGWRDIGVMFRRIGKEGYECIEGFFRKKKLVEQGIEAVVNCNYSPFSYVIYGLPVRKE